MKSTKELIESDNSADEIIGHVLNEVHPRFWDELVLGLQNEMNYGRVRVLDKGKNFVSFQAVSLDDEFKFEINVEPVADVFQFEIVLRSPKTNTVLSSGGAEVDSLSNPKRIASRLAKLRVFRKTI